MPRPVRLRNVTRYVQDVEGNVPLYEAIGFATERIIPGRMAILRHEEGLQLLLHSWDAREPTLAETALSLTAGDSMAESRGYLEASGFRLLRSPDEGDEGFFFIYGDLEGNPVNLVGQRPAQ